MKEARAEFNYRLLAKLRSLHKYHGADREFVEKLINVLRGIDR